MNEKQYDNNLSGVLFKNDKEGNEKRPDYRGSAEIDRVQYWVSGWIREPKGGGDKFMSLKFEAKQAREAGGGKNPPAKTAADTIDFDDKIPF